MTDINYQHIGSYNEYGFQEGFIKQFEKNSSWKSIPEMLVLLRLIGNDPGIVDIRWAAYMLATVMWETTSPIVWEEWAKDKKGKPLIDKKGKAIMVKRRAWLMTMAPVDEIGHGKGRRYQDPVKVAVLCDGSVRITEQDGDQFLISTIGVVKKLKKGAKMGADADGPISKIYLDDDGTEHIYYGRGYVQLTWWSNYAQSGIAIGRGFDLLLDPDLVKEAAVAYMLMSHGMRTGEGFANGHKFSEFFSGQSRNYKGARKMVNGTDKAEEIAKLAEAFEKVLFEALPTMLPSSRMPLITYC